MVILKNSNLIFYICLNILKVADRISFNLNGSQALYSKHTCPYPSVVGWGILIQYLLLVKLFLTTLLTAMFSHTKAKVDAESDQIVIISFIHDCYILLTL